MSLTAADVHDTQFRVVFRGYDIAAVDAFLDAVQEELTRLAASVEHPTSAPAPHPARAEADTAALGGRHAHNGDGSTRAVQTLRLAEQIADQIVASAGAEADQVQAQARDTAAELVARAKAEAETTLAEAQTQAESMLASARAEVDQLTVLERTYRAGLQALLRDAQSLLDQPAVRP